jgi:nucleotide-binding universal stress UspA family protein
MVEVSYFPTKILLATDASKDAATAAQMASEIANNSSSELHVLHVGNTKDFHVAPGASVAFAPAPVHSMRSRSRSERGSTRP